MRALFTLHVPKSGNNYVTDGQVRQIFANAGYAPIGMPENDLSSPCTSDTDRKHYEEKAQAILEHMPIPRKGEEDPKLRAQQSIIFTSTDTQTGADFMVVRETNGQVRVRMYHQRLEMLQTGVRVLLDALGIQRQPPVRGCLSVAGDIQVFEHGLATPTIRGTLVFSRFSYAIRHSRKDVILLVLSATIAAILVGLDYFSVFSHNSKLSGHIERATTALLTTSIVSLFALWYVAWHSTPPIQWSMHYDAET